MVVMVTMVTQNRCGSHDDKSGNIQMFRHRGSHGDDGNIDMV